MSRNSIVRLFTCSVLIAFLPLMANCDELNLLPKPQKIEIQNGQMQLRDGFEVRYSGIKATRLERSVARLYDRLSMKLGFVVLPHPVLKTAPVLEISCDAKGNEVQTTRDDESYSLTVSPGGASLHARQELGVLRGLETLYQLAANTQDGFGSLPAVSITDSPRFAWRGLLLDVARHYMTVQQIEREIDGLAAVKMNVLHLHLADDQSFRVQSKKVPELTEKSSHGQYYTREEMKRVISYARDRGVRVIPEFDVPGHSTAWLAALPELAVNKADPEEQFIRFGGYKNTLDPSNPKLLKLLDKLFGEMADLFPDEYFHIGGDEVDYSAWKNSASIAKIKEQKKLADDRAVQAYFNTQLEKILHKHGKKMVGWNEILHADLPKTTVVHSWTGVSPLEEAVNRGYPVICSLGYYLDWFMPADFYYGIDPLHPSPDTFDKLMSVLPVNGKGKLPAQKKQAQEFRPSPEAERLVLGGEAAEWTELAAPWVIDAVIWPRVGAIAERLWSPGDVKDASSLYRRLEVLGFELSDLGISPDEDLRKQRIRLAGNTEAAQVISTFGETVEPKKYYTRNARQKKADYYNVNSPLNRTVDSIPPENLSARRFGLAVGGYMGKRNPQDLSFLKSTLGRWQANEAPLAELIAANPRLHELKPLAEFLVVNLRAAQEAIGYLERGEQAPASWISSQQELLAATSANDADLELAIAPYVKQLVDAAGAVPRTTDEGLRVAQ